MRHRSFRAGQKPAHATARHLPVNPIGQQASSAIILPACVALLCTAVLITILGQYTDLDLLLADLYFDSQRQIFPWDTTWFARTSCMAM